MKVFYTISLLMLLSVIIQAQQTFNVPDYPRWQISANFGNIIMTGLPKEVDQQGSNMLQIGVDYHFHLSKKQLYLSVGAGYEESHLMADGYFVKNENTWLFEITPSNYKQHELVMQYLQVPVQLKLRPFAGGTIAFGPYFGYLLNADSKFKIGTEKYRVDAPVQNKFRAGLRFDEEFILFARRKQKVTTILGLGMNYQLTRNLQDDRSFKPLGAYLKAGFGFR